ncbi:hypothetical protein TWF506_007222 [Arthrobotrys conoides]|uniref:Uncharacterized protein n=1 Tax=Arthrobotrys conoides TaxID=74498 RepID=A0AAN8RXV0_9PEZI
MRLPALFVEFLESSARIRQATPNVSRKLRTRTSKSLIPEASEQPSFPQTPIKNTSSKKGRKQGTLDEHNSDITFLVTRSSRLLFLFLTENFLCRCCFLHNTHALKPLLSPASQLSARLLLPHSFFSGFTSSFQISHGDVEYRTPQQKE